MLSSSPAAIQETLAQIQLKARDHARTPVQWSSAPHGGFTTAAEPWMRANPDYQTCNAEAQIHDQGSVYNHWASLLAMRKKYKQLFVHGSFEIVDEENQAVFAYERVACESGGARALVILNWSEENAVWSVPSETRARFAHGRLVLGNCAREDVLLAEEGHLDLAPWEALVILDGNHTLPRARI